LRFPRDGEDFFVSLMHKQREFDHCSISFTPSFASTHGSKFLER
jgi:hypothetical protein